MLGGRRHRCGSRCAVTAAAPALRTVSGTRRFKLCCSGKDPAVRNAAASAGPKKPRLHYTPHLCNPQHWCMRGRHARPRLQAAFGVGTRPVPGMSATADGPLLPAHLLDRIAVFCSGLDAVRSRASTAFARAALLPAPAHAHGVPVASAGASKRQAALDMGSEKLSVIIPALVRYGNTLSGCLTAV
jgi:hypothetical protein